MSKQHTDKAVKGFPFNARNNTTNYSIPNSIFIRECKEFDAGVLPHEHERYLGESYEEN